MFLLFNVELYKDVVWRLEKEVEGTVVAYFRLLSKYVSGGTEENWEKRGQLSCGLRSKPYLSNSR